jgi:hypothetical protein
MEKVTHKGGLENSRRPEDNFKNSCEGNGFLKRKWTQEMDQ